MLHTPALQVQVRGVQGEEGRHQQDLRGEDDRGIAAWPRGDLGHPEPLQPKHLAADQENEAGQEHTDGEPFEAADQEVIERAEEAEHAVRAEEAIDDDLEHLEVDDDETRIDHDVQDARDGPHHHLALAHRHADHQHPAFALAVVALLIAPQADVAHHAPHVPGEEAYRGDHHQDEDDARNAHFFCCSCTALPMRSMSLSLNLGSLSFLPKTETWTYRFGFKRRSSSNRSSSLLDFSRFA